LATAAEPRSAFPRGSGRAGPGRKCLRPAQADGAGAPAPLWRRPHARPGRL